jgi:hypothetical protein
MKEIENEIGVLGGMGNHNGNKSLLVPVQSDQMHNTKKQ